MRRTLLYALGCCVLSAGCDPEAYSPPSQEKPAAIQSTFDPSATGSIRGTVQWSGATPSIPAIRGLTNPSDENAPLEPQVHSNPHVPLIDPASGGVGSAVIFLRGVAPGTAKPWDLPPVSVEMSNYAFQLCQGESRGPYGFVRRGDPVSMISHDRGFHAVHAEGATFFSLMFPDPEQPLSRRLNHSGLVELSSAAGYYWMRAYLFVADHPYYCRTGHAGQFSLSDVPAGTYEVVCWMPNWHQVRQERDPETAVVVRWYFGPPTVRVQKIHVARGQTCTCRMTLSAADFAPPPPEQTSFKPAPEASDR